MMPTDDVFDKPFGRDAILGISERIVHLDVGSTQKVIVPFLHGSFDFDDSFLLAVRVDSLTLLPSAVVFVGTTIQPLDDSWSANIQFASDLGMVFTLLGKSECRLNIFSLMFDS